MSYTPKQQGNVSGGSGTGQSSQQAKALAGISQQMQSLVHGQGGLAQGVSSPAAAAMGVNFANLNITLQQQQSQQRYESIIKQQQLLFSNSQIQHLQQMQQNANEPLALTRGPNEMLNKSLQQHHHQQQQANGSTGSASLPGNLTNQQFQQLQAFAQNPANLMQQLQAYQYQMQQQHQQAQSVAAVQQHMQQVQQTFQQQQQQQQKLLASHTKSLQQNQAKLPVVPPVQATPAQPIQSNNNLPSKPPAKIATLAQNPPKPQSSNLPTNIPKPPLPVSQIAAKAPQPSQVTQKPINTPQPPSAIKPFTSPPKLQPTPVPLTKQSANPVASTKTTVSGPSPPKTAVTPQPAPKITNQSSPKPVASNQPEVKSITTAISVPKPSEEPPKPVSSPTIATEPITEKVEPITEPKPTEVQKIAETVNEPDAKIVEIDGARKEKEPEKELEKEKEVVETITAAATTVEEPVPVTAPAPVSVLPTPEKSSPKTVPKAKLARKINTKTENSSPLTGASDAKTEKKKSNLPKDVPPAPATTTPKISKPAEIVPKASTPENTTKAALTTPDASKSGSAQLENTEGHDDRRSKRHRLKTIPYQSPLPELAFITKLSVSETSNSPKPIKDNNKLTLFYKHEYLAVRNAESGFFLCQTIQNVYRKSPRIRIRWLSEERKDDHTYVPDFYDVTDIECVLTTVDMEKVDKDKYKLPKSERDRIENILRKAIDVEKGITPRPDVTEENPDGLDISLYKDESQIEKKSETNKRKADSISKSPKRSSSQSKTPKKKKKTKPKKKASLSSNEDESEEETDNDKEYKPSRKRSLITQPKLRAQRSPLAKARVASPITINRENTSKSRKSVPPKSPAMSARKDELIEVTPTSAMGRTDRAKRRATESALEEAPLAKKLATSPPKTLSKKSLTKSVTKNKPKEEEDPLAIPDKKHPQGNAATSSTKITNTGKVGNTSLQQTKKKISGQSTASDSSTPSLSSASTSSAAVATATANNTPSPSVGTGGARATRNRK